MNWTIRTADAASDDCERLALIGAASFLDGFAGLIDGDAVVTHCRTQHRADRYRVLLDHSNAAAWLAERDGAPVGYALVCTPDLADAEPGDLELKRIYLLSRFHGSGMATALMAKAERHARAHGAARLLLGVYQGNHRATRFYRRHGFVVIGTRRFAVGDHHYDDWVMAMTLGGDGADPPPPTA